MSPNFINNMKNKELVTLKTSKMILPHSNTKKINLRADASHSMSTRDDSH